MFHTLTKTEREIIISVAQKKANGLNYSDDCEKRKDDIQYKEELMRPGQWFEVRSVQGKVRN